MNGTRTIPYLEYCRYYGDPSRHVAVIVDLFRQCPHCQGWTPAGSLCGIDFMDDAPELRALDTTVTGWEAIAALPGYLADVARELIADDRREDK